MQITYENITENFGIDLTAMSDSDERAILDDVQNFIEETALDTAR